MDGMCRCIKKEMPLHASIINQTQLTEKLKKNFLIAHLSSFINSFFYKRP